MSKILLYNNHPMAAPAFRLLIFLKGSLDDRALRSALAKIYARFETDYGERASVASYHFAKHKGDFKHIKPELLEAGRAFFDREKSNFGDGIRRYGMLPKEFDNPALPFLCVEQYRAFTLLEMALPPESRENLPLADAVVEEIKDLSILCGVMGYGFFLPPYKSSLVFMLGQASQRYRAAIEITPKMVDQGIQREGSYYHWKPGEEPGIADLSWRTLVGKDFLPRLPALPEESFKVAGVTVEEFSDFISFTIGSVPIWGDINGGEAIEAYREVAAYLEPIRYPESGAHISFFQGENPDRIEAYLARYGK